MHLSVVISLVPCPHVVSARCSFLHTGIFRREASDSDFVRNLQLSSYFGNPDQGCNLHRAAGRLPTCIAGPLSCAPAARRRSFIHAPAFRSVSCFALVPSVWWICKSVVLRRCCVAWFFSPVCLHVLRYSSGFLACLPLKSGSSPASVPRPRKFCGFCVSFLMRAKAR